MVTARDVARLAGVSTSTVSHVGNGTRVVSEGLRARVLSAMQELGYEPNAVARSLKIKRSHTLALVVSDIGNPFFGAVVRGVEDAAKARGYSVLLGNSEEDPAREEEYLRLLAMRRVDGVLLVPAGSGYPYLERVARTGVPLVFLDRVIPGLPVPGVVLDNATAACDAVRHLISLGHRRIGMVGGRRQVTTTTERVAGYRAALEEAEIEFDPRLVAFGDSRTEEARVATDRLLSLMPRPTALFVGNNLMTVGAVATVEARGLRVPEDVALVGFDDEAWAEVFRPRLTTVSQPSYELGRAATELLLRRISAPGDDIPARIVLSGRLIVRESCGAQLAGATSGSRGR